MRPWLGSFGFRARFVRFLMLTAFGALVLVLLGGGCGRTSLEPETLDSGTTSTQCGPSTCPNGCCDASGVCRTGFDVRACGSVGGRCTDCVANGFTLCNANRVCGRDDPACSPSSCPTGCCATDEGQRRCLSGTEGAACGRNGDACANCTTEGRACDVASRACGSTTCSPANCNGCCVGDKCLPGDATTACGTRGAACDTCATGQVCRAASGGGGVCEGTRTCGPANCGGCCNAAGQCVAGNDTTACGKGGQACSACGLNSVCVRDGLPNERTCQLQTTCGPTNCPGCCVGNQCVTATTPTACGTNGQQCKTCPTGQVCNASGTCVPGSECNPANCAGCCVGDICAVGTQNTACGAGGGQCLNCVNQNPSRVCQSGSCQLPACGPQTCPNGCCSGNTCVVGTQNNACGAIGGGACNDCTAQNQVCVNRACSVACGPANCTGCCLANNTCDIGIGNTTCGAGGVACANCAAQGSFCNGLVVPRRCNNQQSTCPAAYGACPGGTATPIVTALQNVCTDAQLDTLALATTCDLGADDPACIAAVTALGPTCAACVSQFRFPFIQKAGLFACAAAQLGDLCRRATGCAVDCAQTSCEQCLPTAENQCYSLVNGLTNQCGTFDLATACAAPALQAGQLCSQASYPTFGQWLRTVSDHYCGNGP